MTITTLSPTWPARAVEHVRARLAASPIVIVRRRELQRRERNAFDLGCDFGAFHGPISREVRA